MGILPAATEMMRPQFLATHVLQLASILVVFGACEPETPPAPKTAPATKDDALPTSSVKLGEQPAVLTFAGEKGSFADGKALDEVPEASRGMVRVTVQGGEPPPAGHVWVANLKTPKPDGSFELKPVRRDRFEEYALGQGLSSKIELPDGLEPPKQWRALEPGEVVVYKTSWCGVCKKLEGYLKRKNIPYVAKDIEKDQAAAAELAAKAKQAGIDASGVPVVDVGGQLMVGFDRARLEAMLKS